MNKNILISLLIIIILGAATMYFVLLGQKETSPAINSFEDCVSAGYSVSEDYPRQCKTPSGEIFTEDINNLGELNIIVSSPLPNELIQSPLVVEGKARGTWFFEADFPVILVDWDGLIIAEGIARTEENWMTEDFISFEAKIEFEKPTLKNNGTLILRKDNPSGLPEYDDALEIPIIFE